MNELTETTTERGLSVQQQAVVAIESNRAAQEVQSALLIAKKFPRDETAAYNRIMTSCKRISLANQAIYNLPISGKNQSGPSIRLAEVLAQAWGNLKFGFHEYGREDGKSSCKAYCHDLETNTNSEIDFEVEHYIEIGKKENKSKKWISDPAEIDRLVANRGSKKLRQCILKVIPPDIVEDAMNQCKDTIKKGDGSPISDRARKMVVAFGVLGVTQDMIEKRLGHAVDLIDADELVDLTAIYKALIDKAASRSYYFDTGEEPQKEKKSALNDLLSKDKPKEPTPISSQDAEPPL